MAVEMTSDESTPADTRTLGPSRMWLWIPALGVGALLVIAGIAVRKTEPEPDRPSADMRVTNATTITVKPGAPQWTFLKVTTVGAVGTHFTDTVPARITIDDSLASRVGVPVSGRVTSVMVELGDSVRAGQPLFAVSSPAVAELRTDREQAMVELDAATVNLQRVEATVASRALPMKELQTAQQRYKNAQLAVDLANRKLAAFKVSPGADHEFVIQSPRTGVVVSKDILVNQQVSAEGGAPLMVVADLSSVWAIADVFEGQTPDLKPGGGAEVTTPSLPGATFNGRILMVASVGDPDRHTLPVRILLPNPDRRLRPNVYARVRFPVQSSAQIEIPATALVSDGEKQYVYVQTAQGRFERRDIVAGSAHEGRLPVISGLTAGEVIVEQGAILLDNQIAIVTQ